jgi:hypothetical protein
MCSERRPSRQSGSVLLLTLMTTAVMAMLALSFAATMKGNIQVTRDQNASLHSNLAAQSGLEYALHHLLIDPEWPGTAADVGFGEGSAFRVERLEGPSSRIVATEIALSIEGVGPASLTRLHATLLVTPGDPLLDKAVSILGGASGTNLVIGGDYLMRDADGHLWDFREDLVAGLNEDSRISFTEGKHSALEVSYNAADLDALMSHISRRPTAGTDKNSRSTIRGIPGGINGEDRRSRLSSLERWKIDGGGNSHLKGMNMTVEGVWLPSDDATTPTLSLSRVDAPGDLYNYSANRYAWASGQVQEEDPVHVPGWEFGAYLDPGTDRVVFDRVTSLKDMVLEQTAVFILDPGQTLSLTDVELRGGMVVFAEADYDPAGPERNQLVLAGSCVIGGGDGGIDGIGMLAPGCRMSTSGAERQEVTGFSVVHSLSSVQRLIHHGVLIVLNRAVGMVDSTFTYDRNIAASPPTGLIFFGDLPGVDIVLLREDFEETIEA